MLASEYRLPGSVHNGIPFEKLARVRPMKKKSERERTAFGARLLRAREDAGLTQMQVCDALNMKQSTLSELEIQANSSGWTAQLANLYGVDAHYLATGEAGANLPAAEGDDPFRALMDNLARVPPEKRSEALLAAVRAVTDVLYGTAQKRAAAREADAAREHVAPAPSPPRQRARETEPTGAHKPTRPRTAK
jgi:transcriptional regulator with XRE-family HTH domain